MLTKFLYQESAQLSQNDLEKLSASLKDYTQRLQSVLDSKNYDEPESSINLPFDELLYQKVMALKDKKVTGKLQYIIDVGIGGSNLGTKAVYDALQGFYDVLQPNKSPKIIFLDTVEETTFVKLSSILKSIASADELLINAVSKSGGTTETIANLEVLLEFLNKKFPDILKRVVITTDEGSKFWQRAQELNVDVLPIPKQVGGRYSVLSAVGLFPLACCGFNIRALLDGAQSVLATLQTPEVVNDSMISAIVTYFHLKNGRNITDSFFFAPQLESVGKWYRQLTGESLGKEHDLQGNVVHAGITPTVSIGSTDLHSVGQLYLGGPRDKVTTFIYTSNEPSMIALPSTLQFPLVEGIGNKSLREIMHAILEGVKITYTKQELPFMEIAMDTITEQSLGEFLEFKMIEMMYLGKLLNVNVFDQPHVELYKTETKRILNTS